MNREKYLSKCGFSYLAIGEKAPGVLECKLTNRRCVAFKKCISFLKLEFGGKKLAINKYVKPIFNKKIMTSCPLYSPKKQVIPYGEDLLINLPDKFTIRNLVLRLIKDIKIRGQMENKFISGNQAIKDIIKYGKETLRND